MTKIDTRSINSIAIHLHGQRVGVVTRFAGDRHLFAFDQEYIDDPARATLSLSFKGRLGGLVTALRPVGRRVPPFFANLLPEGHLRAYLAERAGINPQREFYLLAALGSDLAGAVTAHPITANGEVEEPPVDPPRSGPAPALRFSLAGVQLKFSALQEASGGLTVPAGGTGGAWIVKLPSMRFPAVPENEFVMLELARASGIEVPPIRLIAIEEVAGLPAEAARMPGRALATQRFDRAPDGRRIHMEDFAQVFGIFPDDKYKFRSYANIGAVLWAEAGQEAAYEFVRRIVFSVLIGNADMHLKNWSILYPDGRTPALSPAYDFVATLPYLPGDRLALSFGFSRSLEEMTLDQVRRFVDQANMPTGPTWQLVGETVERTVQAWRTLTVKDLMPRDLRAAVGAHIETVAATIAAAAPVKARRGRARPVE